MRPQRITSNALDKETEPLLTTYSAKTGMTNNNSVTSENDPMIADGKRLPLSGPVYLVVLRCILYAFVLIPLWLVLFVPLTLLCQAVIYLTKCVSPAGGKKKRPTADEKGEANFEILKAAADTAGRKFDVIIFGATGFTGRMAATYMASHYGLNSDGGEVKWAIAGRRRAALESVRADLISQRRRTDPRSSAEPSPSEAAEAAEEAEEALPIVVADSADVASLQQMACMTKVVATTAGPFDKYGTALVQCCAQCGTHYCDITGETDWVRRMIDLFDPLAQRSGARIVHFCGHDCVPWDLLTLACAQKLQEKFPGEQLGSIRFYDEINSAPSGGTLATVFHSLAGRSKYKSQLGFDPLLKTVAGSQSSNKFSLKVQGSLGYSKERRRWVGPFVMAMVMANCIRRSNALNNYSSKLRYYEAVVYPSFAAGFISLADALFLATVIFCPPLSWLCLAIGLLPQPGQGPSEADMDEGFLKITAYANSTSNGDRTARADVMAVMYFPTDPGYRDTARMLVESALCLALPECERRVRVGGGVWTPAACQGSVLTERLLETGCTLAVQ